MKKIIFVLTGLILFSSTVLFSQDEVKNENYSGRMGLLFTFRGFSDLGAGNFQGGIGGKLFMTNQLALRAGVLFASEKNNIPANPNPGQSGQDGKISATEFGVNAAVEFHLFSPQSYRVSPYIGGGVGFNTTSTENDEPVVGNNNQRVVKNNINGEQIGDNRYFGGTELSVFALLGAEFFLFKELSLAAEYRLGFSSVSKSDQEITVGNNTNTTQTGSTTSFGINNQGFLTLAFYF